MVINDNFYMQLALDEAWKYQGLTFPNPAVGCVIVDKNGTLLSIEAHIKAGEAHAEVRAVMSALKKLNPSLEFPQNAVKQHEFICKNHQNFLKDATVYVTLEPCNHYGSTPPCALMLATLHVKRVVIGMLDPNNEAAGGKKRLENDKIKVTCNVLENECQELLEPFIAWQNGNFSFFKLAQSVNGVIDGGIITCKASREFVHKLRDRTDLLIIGGGTVREDYPTLDARLCGGRAPDVLIYSRQREFDKDMPLFKIPKRKVHIRSDFEKLKDYKFIMIEGGYGMIHSLPIQTKWFLLFHSPNFKEGRTVHINKNLKLLWQGKCGEDSYGWYKNL